MHDPTTPSPASAPATQFCFYARDQLVHPSEEETDQSIHRHSLSLVIVTLRRSRSFPRNGELGCCSVYAMQPPPPPGASGGRVPNAPLVPPIVTICQQVRARIRSGYRPAALRGCARADNGWRERRCPMLHARGAVAEQGQWVLIKPMPRSVFALTLFGQCDASKASQTGIELWREYVSSRTGFGPSRLMTP